MNTSRARIARAAIVGQLVFVGGWLVIGAIEGHGYDALHHEISDLAALTAHHATADRITLAISGSLTVALAFVLRAHLGNAALLLAFSLPGLDSLSDVFFRLDCRAADAGCSMSDATASWHGKTHIAVFVVAALVTLAAPFVLARAMRRQDAWSALAGRTKAFGFVLIAMMVGTGATSGTPVGGLTQRVTAGVAVAGVAALAWHVVRVEERSWSQVSLIAGR